MIVTLRRPHPRAITRTLDPMLGRRAHRWLWIGTALTMGCFNATGVSDTGIDDDYMDDQPPPGDCPGTGCPTPGTAGSPVGGPCLDTQDCASDAICVAEFDGEVQSFLCQEACVPLMDDTQWCADDQSCCEGARCSPRGFCLPPGETEGLDSGTDGQAETTGENTTYDTGDTESTGSTGSTRGTGSTGSARSTSGTGSTGAAGSTGGTGSTG